MACNRSADRGPAYHGQPPLPWLAVLAGASGIAFGADWLGAAFGLDATRIWVRMAATGVAAALAVPLALQTRIPALPVGRSRTLGMVMLLLAALITWGIAALAAERAWFDGISMMLILLITLPVHAAIVFLRGARARPVHMPAARPGASSPALLLPPLAIVFAGYALLPPETTGSRFALPLLLVVTVWGAVLMVHSLAISGAWPKRLSRISDNPTMRVLAIILSVLAALLMLAALLTHADPVSRGPVSRGIAAIAGCVMVTSIAVALSPGIRHRANKRSS